MIFVDTSVWVAAFRAGESHQSRHLRELLDADQVGLPVVVRLELLAGASRQDRPRLKRTLSALPTFYPTDTTWPMIEGWLERATEAGQRFALTDLLIGALAEERQSQLWSLDGDFERLANLVAIRLYRSP